MKILPLMPRALALFFFIFSLSVNHSFAVTFSNLGSISDPDGGEAEFAGSTTYGDINGDGYQDLIVPSPRYGTDVGRVYVFLGGATLDTTADYSISGEANNDYLPFVFYTGRIEIADIDGDGYDDIPIGARGNDSLGSDYGVAAIFWGSSNISGDKTVDEGDVVFNPGAASRLGAGSVVGDFNGDGNLDVAFGAVNYNSGEGGIYVYYGNGTKNFDTTVDVILAVSGSNSLGYGTTVAGDYNGDGYDDIFASENVFSTANRYIFFGGSTMDATQDIKIVAETSSDYLAGMGNAAFGDITGDGKDDLCIGAPLYSASDEGRVYCFFSSNNYSGGETVNASDADIILDTPDSGGDRFGWGVDIADANNDGKLDLVISQQGEGSGGGTYIYLGSGSTSFDTTYDSRIDTAGTVNNNANIVDTNGNYWPELVIGDAGGAVYVLETDRGTPSLTGNFANRNTVTGKAVNGSNINFSGVQWSLDNSQSGSWTSCTAKDGSFNSNDEKFSCDVSSTTIGSTIYFRSFDSTNLYLPLGLFLSVGDSAKPTEDDEEGLDDFELVGFSGSGLSTFTKTTRGGDKIPVIKTSLSKPNLKFEQIGDSGSGVGYYQIRLTDTHKKTDQKKGEDYVWVDNITASNPSGNDKRSREGFDIYYRTKGENKYIEIDVEGNDYKLEGGNYYLKIRAYDKAGNHTDSDEIFLQIADEFDVYDDPTSEGVIPTGNLTLQSIGSIQYNSIYNLYYYTSSNLVLTGTAIGNIVLSIDGQIAKEQEANGVFRLEHNLSPGRHTVQINDTTFVIQIDPTRESFPKSLQ